MCDFTSLSLASAAGPPRVVRAPEVGALLGIPLGRCPRGRRDSFGPRVGALLP